MSYVQKILQPNERIIYAASIHWVVYLRSVFLFVVGGAILVAWFIFQPQLAEEPFLSGSIIGIAFLFFAFAVYALLMALIERHSTELVITNLRVIAKIGFIRRRTWEINAAKVEGVEVDQSVLGRILDFGTVTVKGTGGGTAPICNIDDPVAFRAQVTSL
jgi:uncharacterized membrane protein YdbT with pleckstrin-like domain